MMKEFEIEIKVFKYNFSELKSTYAKFSIELLCRLSTNASKLLAELLLILENP